MRVRAVQLSISIEGMKPVLPGWTLKGVNYLKAHEIMPGSLEISRRLKSCSKNRGIMWLSS